MTPLKNLSVTDQTWQCYGTHSPTGKKEALLVWRIYGAFFGSMVASPSAASHADAMKILVENGTLSALPRVVEVDAPDVDRLLGRVLGPLGVAVRQVSAIPPIDVDRVAADFILDAAARAMAPAGTAPEVCGRLHQALSALRLDESWLRIPLNRTVLVEGIEPEPFGLLIHADCCPGFTVLPLDGRLRASRREGIVVLRLPQSERYGVLGRWPLVVEEGARRHAAEAFQGPQLRLTPLAAARMEAAIDVVLQLGLCPAKVPPGISLRRDPPVPVRLRQQDLGVVSMTMPLASGSQHVRLRAS